MKQHGNQYNELQLHVDDQRKKNALDPIEYPLWNDGEIENLKTMLGI